MKIEFEELIYVKDHFLDDKVFFIFSNGTGELRVVDASILNHSDPLSVGEKFQATIHRKGCAGREIVSLSAVK